MKPSPHKIDVALPLGAGQSFTYLAQTSIDPGSIVKVSFRNKEEYGVAMGPSSVVLPSHVQLKEAHKTEFSLKPSFFKFLQQVSSYTLTPLGMVWKMVKSGVDLDKFHPLNDSLPPIQYQFNLSLLNPSQEKASHSIINALGQYQNFLLEGVTGSGKTEVYFEVVAAVLKQGKQALVMLPEIGLTQQFFDRFQLRFGQPPLIFHSHQTPKKRKEIWEQSFTGNPCVIVGTRSSLFLPFDNLGVIIVDEEHDSSYKQEEQSLYHARDMAIWRAYYEKCPVVLCSATPSLESIHNVRSKKSHFLKLEERFGDAVMPDVTIIDMREQKRIGFLSNSLIQAIHQRLQKKEQSLLFLNRRGFSPLYLCTSCGHQVLCPSCSITLHYHKNKKGEYLLCHHCSFEGALPKKCPSCEQDKDNLIPYGPGVQRITEELKKLFPLYTVVSLTSDHTQKEMKDAWEGILNHKVDIIVGTQLLAKGHHIPNLTLVGVIDGDMGLRGMDWRANEKTFQLLQQVAGRAGREQKRGEVLIQTFQSEHFLFETLKNNEQDEFIEQELTLREHINLPPFSRIAHITLSSMDSLMCEKEARKLSLLLQENVPDHVQVMGPIEAPLFKLRGRYRYRLLLKSPKNFNLSQCLGAYVFLHKLPSTVQLVIDIDPMSP